MNLYHLSRLVFLQLFMLLLFVLCLPELLNAQKRPAKKQAEFKAKGDDNCVYRPEYTREQRLEFYPFNIADSIKIVSFRNHLRSYPIDSNRIVIQDSLIEQKMLDTNEIEGLTDILYNNFFREPPNVGTLTACFEPRNAILFFDKSGLLKEYIIICFHCGRFESSSDKINFGDKCSQKMEEIRIFFKANHIFFGTDLSIDGYPGESSQTDVVAPPVEK